eukprot:7472404-Pyramimonas_sp.AAC.1
MSRDSRSPRRGHLAGGSLARRPAPARMLACSWFLVLRHRHSLSVFAAAACLVGPLLRGLLRS